MEKKEELLHEALELFYEVTDNAFKENFMPNKKIRIRTVLERVENKFGLLVKEKRCRACYNAMKGSMGLPGIEHAITNNTQKDYSYYTDGLNKVLGLLQEAAEIERAEIIEATKSEWWMKDYTEVTGIYNNKPIKMKGGAVTRATFIEMLQSRFKRLVLHSHHGHTVVDEVEQKGDRFEIKTGIGKIEIEYDEKFPVKIKDGDLIFFKAL